MIRLPAWLRLPRWLVLAWLKSGAAAQKDELAVAYQRRQDVLLALASMDRHINKAETRLRVTRARIATLER